MSVEEVAHEDVDLEQLLKCSLPTSRVKKICRLDPDLTMIGSDAVLFVTKATIKFFALEKVFDIVLTLLKWL
ncbi:hypothetical protein ANCCAN_11377 [Ancylostoma caninum]|uniref:Transcription factor CBF/NF-Y/archaeal histone domain-containing protein n=1 Tax=Ancylostoma caninum TaxID=29170 RepID=A0A368GE33_ANCCA|nr:hypothetical protein ANCCAN_11377 [Ancylostoma caninum]